MSGTESHTRTVVRLLQGDAWERLAELEGASVGAVICDPPYGLSFMGTEWDRDSEQKVNIAFDPEFWMLVNKVLRPGGIVKAFGGTRTFHRVCRAMQRASFLDIHVVAWAHGQGFPKSTNISKRIDKQAGAEREVVGYKRGVGGENMNDIVHGREVRQTTDEGGKGVGAYGTGAKQVAVDVPITKPATEAAILWDGYGTALKPSWEPICVARKAS